MKSCPKCLNLTADNAAACEHCGTVLDASFMARTSAAPHRAATVVEVPDALRPSPPPPMMSHPAELRPSPPPPLPVPVPGANPGGGPAARRGVTVYLPQSGSTASASASPGAGPARAAARRVVAILVTYSWKPEGQVFPVREGRNLIGRGEECDVCVPEDPTMSQVNSHITFRQNFMVGDMVSMSGTDLNGEPVEEQFRPMKNYAQIRTGSTHWTFVIVDPALRG